MKRWLPRALVILTALLCLGVGGYAGQAWQARRIGDETAGEGHRLEYLWKVSILKGQDLTYDSEEAIFTVGVWKRTPWWGEFGHWRDSDPLYSKHFWFPKRSRYEALKSGIGIDLGNDPAAWEAWFLAHPNLVWDRKRKRLVEIPPPGK